MPTTAAPNPNRRIRRRVSPLQRRLSRLFAQPGVELTVAVLVVISVVLSLTEFAYLATSDDATQQLGWLRIVRSTNDAITAVFMVELTLRMLAASSKWRYLQEYWIEILAVAPLYQLAPGTRLLMLLRLIRVLRLFGVVSRLASHFPYLVRRSVIGYLSVCGLLVFTVLLGTGAMMVLEAGSDSPRGTEPVSSTDGPVQGEGIAGRAGTPRGETSAERTERFRKWFWFNVYSLFAGEPIPSPPETLGGKLVAVLVMFMGVTIFAMLTGTISAFMIERLRREGAVVELDDLQDHVIICGWSSKAEIIFHEFQASHLRDTPIVVITEFEHEHPPTLPQGMSRHVHFLNDDFTRVAALEAAGVHRAMTCIILSDTSGKRSEQDADARTILAALTVEKLNSRVYTCAELLNRSYGTHLKMGNVNDYVISGEYGAYLLAQAAMNRGLMDVFSELLTYQRGNEFYRVPMPEAFAGREFLDVFQALKRDHNAILVAVRNQRGQLFINPTEHRFASGDWLVLIAEHEPQF